MKKLLELRTFMTLLLVITISSIFVACGDDDDSPTPSNKKLLLGKWEFVKRIINDKTMIEEFECADKHDYTLFKVDGKVMFVSYNFDCLENITEDIWELSNSTLTTISKVKKHDDKGNYVETVTIKDFYIIKELEKKKMILESSKRWKNGQEVPFDVIEDGKQDKLILYLKKID